MQDRQDVSQARVGLSKRLTLFDFFAIGFGAIIGVGWVISVGDWLNIGGGPLPVILAFAAGALLLFPVGKVYGDLAARQACAGGAMVYARMAFGRRWGFVTGWFLALGYIMLCPWEIIAIGQVAEALFPALKILPLYSIGEYTIYLPTLLINMAVALVIIVSNYKGVDKVARLQRALVATLMGVGLLAIITALVKGDAGAFLTAAVAMPRNPQVNRLTGFLAVLTITPFYFAGFDAIPQEAEESRSAEDSGKISRVVVGSIGAACAFYVLVIIGISGAMPWRDLLGYSLPAAAAYEVGLGMPIVAKIILIGALCGLISTFNSFFMAGARVLLALGRERMVSEKLGYIHPKYQTPYVANRVIAVVSILGSFLGKGLLLPITNVCSFSFVFAWMVVALAAWKLNRKAAAASRTIQRLAIGSSVLLFLLLVLPWSAGALAWPMEWGIVFGWLIAGCVMGAISARKKKREYPTATAGDTKEE